MGWVALARGALVLHIDETPMDGAPARLAVSTVWRYLRERSTCSPPSPGPGQADIRAGRLAYAIIDCTLARSIAWRTKPRYLLIALTLYHPSDSACTNDR